jgi:hypothetical protein
MFDRFVVFRASYQFSQAASSVRKQCLAIVRLLSVYPNSQIITFALIPRRLIGFEAWQFVWTEQLLIYMKIWSQ